MDYAGPWRRGPDDDSDADEKHRLCGVGLARGIQLSDARKEKQKVRRAALAMRDALSPLAVEQQSALVQKIVSLSREFEGAHVVGAYYPKGSEVRTALLIEIAKEQGKKVALPRVEGNYMHFYEYDPADDLVEGRFGVMEPAPRKMPIERIDLMLVPGVAFDRKGSRIGYGKGYYDRFISQGKASFSMGLAYSVQVAAGDDDNLPSGRFDRRLDALAMENEMLYF